MPISDYPFTIMAVGHPARPMLPVRIFNPATGKFVNSLGLIDTGADECAIPAQYANILGHNLASGAMKQINTGNGATNAYAHTTRIDILGLNGSMEVVHTINDTPIDFMPNLGVILLGANNFLSRFILTIDYPGQKFSIKLPTS